MSTGGKMFDVIELECTCSACPSQWEGKTVDEQYVYIRYRWGFLTVGIGKTHEDAVWDETSCQKIGDEYDGTMNTEEMKSHTKDVLRFVRLATQPFSGEYEYHLENENLPNGWRWF